MVNKEINWTPQQKKAINFTEGNVLVSASAGSGKTAVMVERIRKLVVEDGVDINRILVLTFTNAAASEMKAKIIKAIHTSIDEINGKYKNSKKGSDKISSLRRQLNLLAGASIGTFHSNELNIIRRHFDELNLSPSVSFLNDTIAEDLLREAVNEVFLELYEEADREDFLNFIRSYGDIKTSDENLKFEVAEFYKEVRMLPNYLEKLEEGLLDLKSNKRAEDEEDRRLIEESYQPASVLVEIIKRLDQKYGLAKKKKAGIDFTDAEHMILKLFENEDILKSYQEKYEHICVDEYQDCNHMQEAFIRSLNKGNVLFTVGDIKQSIYRFRHAEPEIFEERKQSYLQDSSLGECIFLPHNFRSKPEILEATNAFFGEVFTDHGYDYRQEKLETYHKEGLEKKTSLSQEAGDKKEKIKGNVKLYLYHNAGQHWAKKYKEKYAEEVANIIEDKLSADPGKKSLAGDGGKKYKYSDFAILLRNKSHVDIYKKEFIKRGIPFVTDEGAGLCDSLEVRHLIDVLKVIDNKRMDGPILGLMRSPFFGFTTDDMSEIKSWANEKLEENDLPYHEILEEYSKHGDKPAIKESLLDFYKTIDKWKRLVKFLPIDVVLWQIIDENRYGAFLSGLKNGEGRKRNVRNFLADLADFIANEDSSLYGLLNYLEVKEEEKTSDKKELEDVDAVNIMTMHKSKGLQFPVVFLNLDEPVKTRGMGMNLNKNFQYKMDQGLFVQTYDENSSKKPASSIKKALDQKELEAGALEEICLMYVAWTRAEEELYLLGSTSTKKTNSKFLDPGFDMGLGRDDKFKRFDTILISKNFHAGGDGTSYKEEDLPLKYTNDNFQVHLNSIKKIKARPGLETSRTGSEEKELGNLSSRPVLIENIDKILNRRYKYQLETETKIKYSVTGLANEGRQEASTGQVIEESFMAENSDEDPIGPARPDRSRAIKIGIAYHRLMDEIDFSDPSKQELEKIKDTIGDLLAKGIIEKEIADEIEPERIASFFDWKVIRDNITADFEKERPFVMKTRVKKDDGGCPREVEVLVQGVIDCFFKGRNGEIFLIDYKTDYTTDSLAERYRDQLKLYGQALQKQYPASKISAYIYSFSLGQGIKVDIN